MRHSIDLGMALTLIIMLILDGIAGLVSHTFPTQATPMALAGAIIGVLLLRRRPNLPGQDTTFMNMSDDERAIRRDNAMLGFWLGVAFLSFGAFFTFYNILNTLTKSSPTPSNVVGTATVDAVGIILIIIFNVLVIGVEIVGARAYLSGRATLSRLSGSV